MLGPVLQLCTDFQENGLLHPSSSAMLVIQVYNTILPLGAGQPGPEASLHEMQLIKEFVKESLPRSFHFFL